MASVVTEVDTSWTTQKTWSTGELVTATYLNTYLRDGLNSVKTPAYFVCSIDEAADYTTTSATFADIDATNLAATITTGGGNVRVTFNGVVKSNSAGQIVYFNLDVDGTAYFGDDGATAIYVPGTAFPVSLSVLVDGATAGAGTGLSAGSHTFKLQWKTSTGTATLYAGAGTANYDVHPEFAGHEE